MRVYKTKNKRERLNARIIKNGASIRIARRGYSVHISVKAAKAAIKWTLIIIGTFILFRLGQAAAFAERGYKAYGGEYCILLLPLIWYALSKTFAEMREEIRKSK